MEIICSLENNRVIGDFMGLILVPVGTMNSVGSLLDNECWEPLCFYGSSWDWLMPVVEKISNLPCVDIFSITPNYGCDIYLKNVPYSLDNIEGMNFWTEMDDNINTIRATYGTCVKFLNWYKFDLKYFL